jgi:hypothetical protein
MERAQRQEVVGGGKSGEGSRRHEKGSQVEEVEDWGARLATGLSVVVSYHFTVP